MTTRITRTWFDGEKIVTQEVPESEIYMNEDIARMAREAGPLISTPFDLWCKRFAELVRTDEREACAKVCEEVGEHSSLTPLHCAESIRTRSEK